MRFISRINYDFARTYHLVRLPVANEQFHLRIEYGRGLPGVHHVRLDPRSLADRMGTVLAL